MFLPAAGWQGWKVHHSRSGYDNHRKHPHYLVFPILGTFRTGEQGVRNDFGHLFCYIGPRTVRHLRTPQSLEQGSNLRKSNSEIIKVYKQSENCKCKLNTSV